MLYPKTTRTRSSVELNGIWDFSRELDTKPYHEGFVPEKQVAVPSSFNDLFTDESLRTWEDGVWYSRVFTVPKVLRGERVVLRFGAVSYRAEVFLNGQHIGAHETGYTPFEFDLSEQIIFEADNLLCVRVENRLSPETMPMGNLGNDFEAGQLAGQYPDTPFDFFPYAGIQRPVVIYTTSSTAWLENLCIRTEAIGTAGTVAFKGQVGGRAATVSIKVDGCSVDAPIESASGTFETRLQIEPVTLWETQRPHLYQAHLELLDDSGEILDHYVQRFGVRTIRLDGDQLLLNDKPVYLQGFGRHEDFPIVGKGLNHAVNIRDHELLRWINANSYRTTHYPYSEELIHLADEQGILLIAEAPAVSVNFDYVNERTLATHKTALSELIERDQNSPSVIMWSVANEATTDRPEAVPYFEELVDLVRSKDPTRPVTMVTCKSDADKVMHLFDVVGINVYPGWYNLPGQIEAAKQFMRESLQNLYQRFGKPVLVTEFGADTIAGLHTLPAEQWSEEYQTELLLALIEVMREFDFVIGEHVWNFADFRTAQHFRRVNGNKKGVFTRDRQPKMAAHFLKKVWSKPRYSADIPGNPKGD